MIARGPGPLGERSKRALRERLQPMPLFGREILTMREQHVLLSLDVLPVGATGEALVLGFADRSTAGNRSCAAVQLSSSDEARAGSTAALWRASSVRASSLSRLVGPIGGRSDRAHSGAITCLPSSGELASTLIKTRTNRTQQTKHGQKPKKLFDPLSRPLCQCFVRVFMSVDASPARPGAYPKVQVDQET